MGADYEIRKTTDGETFVDYRCPACGHAIESLLSAAGSRDNCPACGKAVTVAGEAEWRAMQQVAAARFDADSKFAVAWISHSVVETQVAVGALDQAGIPRLAEDFLKNPYDGALATQFGTGRILVREQDLERAKQVIQEALEPCAMDEEEEQDGGEEEELEE